MTVLIFGKTGQVAREIQSRAPVIALGRDDADLANPDSCGKAIETHAPAAVINAAAYTAVDKAEDEECLATAINGHAPAAMAEACAKLDIPLVHISTDYVFNGSGDQPWHPGSVPNPVSAYGRSKLVGEKAVKERGGRFAILRTSWVFSSHGTNFMKTMLRLAETRQELNVVDDQIGGPTPAGDIAEACLAIAGQLASNRSKSGVFHFSGEPNTTWADFARAIFAEAGLGVAVNGIPTSQYLTPAQRPLNSRLSCATTLETFGLPRPGWRAAIPRILRELETAQ